jgi:hypothetical protein
VKILLYGADEAAAQRWERLLMTLHLPRPLLLSSLDLQSTLAQLLTHGGRAVVGSPSAHGVQESVLILHALPHEKLDLLKKRAAEAGLPQPRFWAITTPRNLEFTLGELLERFRIQTAGIQRQTGTGSAT